MPTLPNFKATALARRKTSDITRLATQYKSDINAMTGEYEASYADWSKKRDEVMAPYNKAMDQYKGDYSVYEQSLAAYKEKLTNYTNLLEDINKNPLTELPVTFKNNEKAGLSFNLNGQNYYVNSLKYNNQTLPEQYAFDQNTKKLYQRRDAGTFTEKAPTAPTAPVAPEVADFDTSQFDQKRAALETTYKREVDERKAAKLGAVARKQARPMLQGA